MFQRILNYNYYAATGEQRYFHLKYELYIWRASIVILRYLLLCYLIVYCTVWGLLQWARSRHNGNAKLKCVSLHNGEKYVTIRNLVTVEQKFIDMKVISQWLQYDQHNWMICIELKMVNFLFCVQCGCTKFSCFLCIWDKTANKQHWLKKIRPMRKSRCEGR